MHSKEKLKLWSHNTSNCLRELVTKAGLTVLNYIWCVRAWGMHNNAIATIIVMIFIEIFIIKDNTATNNFLCYF